MKLSELWLREWINPELSLGELCERLTMSGLEIEEAAPVAEKFSGVIVAKVLKVEKHPEAERLHVCEVEVAGAEKLTIVCGAKNVRVGMKAAAALDGAQLANNLKIKTSKLRGIASHGMLCSAKELGLAEESDGLYELPADAHIGENVWDYLNLTDHVIDVSITPNRGDCLSVLGLAHEVSALTESPLQTPSFAPVKAKITDTLSVKVHAPEECPRYAGRIIRHVSADATTPIWMQERLRRSNIRCISPIVDVMNYVMLELGQPMHAFDLDKISGSIHVRRAKAEELALLDGQTVTLDESAFIIADEQKPLAMAGVMGGLESAVSLLTKHVFLESAFFAATSVARMGRQYNLGSESSYRFERGIDPQMQVKAIERATQLILDIAGGEPGPIIDIVHENHLPTAKKIHLRAARISKILGMDISAREVETMLQRLGFALEKVSDGWQVIVPARRFDITLEVDLIEEIIRVRGYDTIPLHQSRNELSMHPRSEKKLPIILLRRVLCDLGYNEVITYSFVDHKLQQLLDPATQPKPIVNPITAEMTVMRTQLWPGLIQTFLYNQNRQQTRVRLFETGLRFMRGSQQLVLSGLVSGSVLPEQWGVPTRSVDFFDVKGDLENLFKLTGTADQFKFKPESHPALHPGQSAEIVRDGTSLGMMGALHPSVMQALDLKQPVFVFELLLEPLETARQPRFSEVSKFPEIRRDLAILVDRAIPAEAIRDTIIAESGKLLQNINVFDVYQGKGISAERKSIALALILQHPSRTLVDEEVAELMERIMKRLKEKFAAELRG